MGEAENESSITECYSGAKVNQMLCLLDFWKEVICIYWSDYITHGYD